MPPSRDREFAGHDPTRTRWGFSGRPAVGATVAAPDTPKPAAAETLAQTAVTREILWQALRALDRIVRTARSRRDYDAYPLALEEGERVLALVKGVPLR